MRVLVADDDRDFCHLLSQVFQGRGWEVVPAYDAMQAVMYARGTPQPDVIVLDIAMPGGTGLGALEKLKASAKTEVIPVVVVSGSIEVEVADQAKARGAVEFLSKPVDPEALALLLEGLIPGRGPGAT